LITKPLLTKSRTVFMWNVTKKRKVKMPTKRTRLKTEKTIHSFVTTFAKNGFHNSSLELLAKDANIAKSTIYLYADSKEELAERVFEDVIMELYVNIVVEQEDRKFLEMINKYYFQNKVYPLFITRMITERSSNEKIKNIFDKYMLELKERLNEYTHGTPSLDNSLLTSMYVNCIHTLAIFGDNLLMHPFMLEGSRYAHKMSKV
jgi:AcrR family transcriptional regulator